MKRLIRSLMSVAIAGALVALLAAPAHANWQNTAACTVNNIYYDSGGVVYVQCGATTYSVWQGRCANMPVTLDTLKVWESMAAAALLSGKSVLITTDTGNLCPFNNGQPILGGITLLR